MDAMRQTGGLRAQFRGIGYSMSKILPLGLVASVGYFGHYIYAQTRVLALLNSLDFNLLAAQWDHEYHAMIAAKAKP
jgi:hypothetical protein